MILGRYIAPKVGIPCGTITTQTTNTAATMVIKATPIEKYPEWPEPKGSPHFWEYYTKRKGKK